MRLSAVLLIIFCLHVNAASYRQSITISEKNAPLEKIFSVIEKQSSYHFIYEDSLIHQAKLVTIQISNGTIQKVLDACFENQPLTYQIIGNTIVVKHKIEEKKPVSTVPPERDIKGLVLNEKGEPLIGASIIIKGGQKGVSSDEHGNFVLKDVPPGSILVFSFAGYQNREIKITSDQSVITIHLEISNSPLDEAQVIAYGTTTRRLNTGDVTTVKGEDIAKQPVSNPLAALEGRVAGLNIFQSNGLPGSPITVQIRGQSSIAASNNPLYLIDGVPFTSTPVEILGGPNGNGAGGTIGSPMNSINPADIESIEILKDADATAIYGSRGANGIIIITTKKGRTGKTNLNININSGQGSVTVLPSILNTQQYLKVRRDALANSKLAPTTANAPDIITWDTTKYTDWQKWYMGSTTKITDATATISGGSQLTTFLLSGTYHKELSVLPGGTPYNRGNVHLNIEHTSLDHKFSLTASTFYTSDMNRLVGTVNGEASSIVRAIPNYPTYDNSGNLVWTGGQTNYVSELASFLKSQTDNLNSNITLKYAILSNINLKVNLGYNKIETNQIRAIPSASQNPSTNPKGLAGFGNQNIKTYLFEPEASYNVHIYKGKLDLLAGLTIQRSIMDGQFFYENNFTSDLLITNPAYGTPYYVSGNKSEYKYISAFGRLTYNWRDKYILNGTIRRDGSTRFGPDKQFGTFGSIGGAWLFSNEEFIQKNISWLTFGKLRGSYGTTGNDGIGDYLYLSTYTNTINYGTTVAITPAQIANPNFQWEVNKKLEISLELGFIKDRILLSSAWYHNRAGNQLVGYSLPSITGFTSYQANLPALVENTGWEIELNTANVKGKNFIWNTSVVLTIPKNKLLKFPGLGSSSYSNTYVIGQPLSIIQKYHFTGVDPATGLATVMDVNKDGLYTPTSSYNSQIGDYLIAGKTAPNWYGGISNTFKYKDLQLDIFFQYVSQQGYGLLNYYGAFGKLNNGWTDFLGYWKNPGDRSSIPSPFYTFNTSINNFANSDAIISDASFLRLKNIFLSYNLPKKLISLVKLNSFKVYVQGQNLWTVTKYKRYDPETANNPTIMVPPLRIITVGIQCSL